MRIVYYSRPFYLDHVLPQAKILSKLVELHLILELSPESWNSSLFNVAPKMLSRGIIPADSALHDCFSVEVQQYWKNCASFNIVVHNCPKSIHPITWHVSHKLAKFIHFINPDVLHFDDVSLRMSWAMHEFKTIPTVLTIHDPKAHSGESNWRGNLARWLTFKQTDKFVLHSKSLKEQFSKDYNIPKKDVETVPLGVLDIFKEWIDVPIKQDDKTILFFGRLSAYKGLEVLYAAASNVAEKITDVRFIIAGRNYPGYLPPNPPVLPNGGQINIINSYIDNKKLAEFFQIATIVVCPYIDASQSGIVLTAYAFDKPVVASNIGGLPEYVKHGKSGLLVEPKDAEALSFALIRMLTNDKLRNDLKMGISQMKQESLNWDKIGMEMVGIYHRALRD